MFDLKSASRDGVHLYAPFFDFTLCGDTDDMDTSPYIDIEPFVDTSKRTVTCKKCIAIILVCRGVRYK